MIFNGATGKQVKQLWDKVKSIVDGTTKVGSASKADSAASASSAENANKLGGNASSYYAAAGDVTKIINGNLTVGKASSATNSDTVDGYHIAVTATDMGEGATVSYANNTIIFVKG
mgnify:CR=1 FL=1